MMRTTDTNEISDEIAEKLKDLLKVSGACDVGFARVTDGAGGLPYMRQCFMNIGRGSVCGICIKTCNNKGKNNG
jgi:hypothetical protein